MLNNLLIVLFLVCGILVAILIAHDFIAAYERTLDMIQAP